MKRKTIGDVGFEAVRENRGDNTSSGRARANADHYAPGQYSDSGRKASQQLKLKKLKFFPLKLFDFP